MKKKFYNLLLIPALTLPFTVAACASPKTENANNTDINETTKNENNNVFSQLNSGFHFEPVANYFKYNDKTNEMFKFKNEGADASKIEFTDFSKNDYVPRHFNFDFDAFKKILVDQLKIDQLFVNKINYKFDYHNIRVDSANIHNVILPIKVLVPAEIENNNKKLFTEHKVEFTLKGIKLKASDIKKYQEVDKLNQELQKQINSENIQVAFDDTKKDEFVALLKKYNINELSTKQLNSIIKLSGFDLDALKQKYPGQGINIFVNEIDLTNNQELNKITLSIRIANGLFEQDRKTKELTEESKTNVGFTIHKEIELNEEWQNVFLDQKLSNNVLYSIKNNNIYNADFINLTANDFVFYSNNKDAVYKIVSYTPIDLRNGLLKFQAKINEKTYDFDKKVGVGNYTNPFEDNFVKENVNAYNFIIDTLTREDLAKVNESIYNIFGTHMLSGGYDSTRSVYAAKTSVPNFLHVGEDYLAPSFTPIVAPYDGEIIGIFNREYDASEKADASSVGTTLMMRVKKSTLNLTPAEFEKHFQIKDDNLDSWMYIGFIHLDSNRTLSQDIGITPLNYTSGNRKYVVADNIDPAHPKVVKKGQIIGFLGSPDTNGGWMPHVHITVYNNTSKNYNENNFFTNVSSTREKRVNGYSVEKRSNPTSIRVDGVFAKSFGKKPVAYEVDPITGKKTKTEAGEFTWISNPMSEQETRNGFVNPNVLFKIRGDESFSFDLEELFELQKSQNEN
ncbi:hypothetical protein KQ875_00140 [Mycoplasma zalophi]|uniref:LIPOPROTEIN n=1 Tax=Mycoplasma zalophi TaxID=191287 RepID=A0ABS6DP84_9MOLU|nr:hypothetical protein [Mycoplasma zalophi]MBU4692009.1 hypothetical protein [Mycoplasma zalophi]